MESGDELLGFMLVGILEDGKHVGKEVGRIVDGTQLMGMKEEGVQLDGLI